MTKVVGAIGAVILAAWCLSAWAADTLDEAAKQTLAECRAKWTGDGDNAPQVCVRWNAWLIENGLPPIWPVEDAHGCYDWRGRHFCKSPQPRVVERQVYVPVPVAPPIVQQRQTIIMPPPEPRHCRTWSDGIGIATQIWETERGCDDIEKADRPG